MKIIFELAKSLLTDIFVNDKKKKFKDYDFDPVNIFKLLIIAVLFFIVTLQNKFISETDSKIIPKYYSADRKINKNNENNTDKDSDNNSGL